MPRPMLAGFVVAIFCCLFFSISCDNAELERTHKQLVVVQTENDLLRRQYSDLQRSCTNLEAEHENLVVQHAELKQWSRKLAAAVGPSVWSPGTYERPIPFRFFKKASATQLVNALNQHFRSIQLPQFKLVDIQNQTAVVQVEDGNQLTQTMGTTGAQGYLGAVTYTLCSVEEIACVDFKFKTGSHAVPGRYCR